MDQARQNRKNISSIETFFDTLLRGKLTDHLFFGDFPTSWKEDWKEVVVVDCGNPVRDYDAYSAGTILVSIYCMPNAYGVKDVTHMQWLESTLNRLIDDNTNPHYVITRRGSYGNYNAVNDVYFNVIQVNIIIS